ncbi:hypothetical protein C6499_07220 [Candidatus Poribacteria bacterium]|nr:MAG: hypothetical protein C6499_07220 [Candidatus Poribacteria bacterium]
MNTTKQIVLVALALVATVSSLNQFNSHSEQKTEYETNALLNQLPQDSVIAISSNSEHTTALPTVPFSDLARLSETDICAAFKTQGVTHLLLTSRDIYSHVSIYGDSISLVETDEGRVVFRYASQKPLMQTSMLKKSDNQLSSIYVSVDETLKHLKHSSLANIKITNVVCEFLSENETLRLPPKEIFFKDIQLFKEENTCPYTIFIDIPNENPFDWTLICVSSILRNSLAIKLYLLDEPSEFFKLVHAFKNKNEYIKVWKLK